MATFKVTSSEKIASEEVAMRTVSGLVCDAEAQILCLSFSPDGTHLAAGCMDNILYVLSLPKLQKQNFFRGHEAPVSIATCTPRARRRRRVYPPRQLSGPGVALPVVGERRISHVGLAGPRCALLYVPPASLVCL